MYIHVFDRLCGLVVRALGYRSRGPGFDSRRYQIFSELLGLQRGSLSLVSIIEELLGRRCSGSGLKIRKYGHRDPSRWPRGTFYPQKLALTSPTNGGLSQTQATEFNFSLILTYAPHVIHEFDKSVKSKNVGALTFSPRHAVCWARAVDMQRLWQHKAHQHIVPIIVLCPVYADTLNGTIMSFVRLFIHKLCLQNCLMDSDEIP
jgi:hypothetical protein